MSSKVIDSFKGEYYFLSNFYFSDISLRLNHKMWTFPTAEHSFQAAKIVVSNLSMEEKDLYIEDIIKNKNPVIAKRLGRKISIDINTWSKNSSDVMFKIQKNKYFQNKELGLKLKLTGDSLLIEGNTWGDRIWGVSNGVGENRLGKILMNVRSLL